MRILVRAEYARGILEELETYGFSINRSSVHVRNRCHNEMIVVDDDAVIIGSHNWSNDGALRNRDASPPVRDQALAGY